MGASQNAQPNIGDDGAEPKSAESMVVAARRCPVSGVIEELTREVLSLLLDVLLAVEADDYLARFEQCRDARGRALVARNGVARPRPVPMGPVSLTIRAPRINDRREVGGVRQHFKSKVLVAGKPPAVGGAYKLAWELICGWASGDFAAVASHLAARGIAGGESVRAALSAKRHGWTGEPLADLRFERVSADFIDCPLAGLDGRRVLVLIGVMPSGRARLVDAELGNPSCSSDWAALVARVRARGVTAPLDAAHDDETVVGALSAVLG